MNVMERTLVSAEQIERFARDGYLVIERLLQPEIVAAVRARFEPLFAGEFETGIYPDEWYWRAGMSLPDITRHMGNAWKSDRTVARVALSAAVGEIVATLSGWAGARLALDTI